MKAVIKSIHLENFKGVKKPTTYPFDGKNATVSGANATGKTTILDAFWWCLFNKDSLGNEKFSIRPLDESGNQIDNVEIKVSLTMDIDGDGKEFSKVQRQRWVKKRGSGTTELQGNENLYEIDGYPKSEKEYKAAISEIVSEEIFKMITSPTYFPNLKWKEQRDILMRFVSEVSDYELASGNPQFAELLDELKKAPSTDDIKAKYQKALNTWKKKQAELPIRIDEASRDKVDIDVAELELMRNSLNEQIAENKAKQSDTDKQLAEYQKLSDGIMELKFAESDLKRKANEDLEKQRRELRNEEYDLCHRADREKSDIGYKKTQIHNCERYIEDLTKDLQKAREEYTTTSNMEFDENDLTCKMCGQPYPEEKAVEIRMDFLNRQNDILHGIAERGNSIKAELQTEKDILEKSKKELETLEKGFSEKEERIEKVREKMRELPQSIDISDTEECKNIQSQIAEKEKAMREMNSADEIRQTLKEEAESLQSQLTECEKQIALSQKNVEIDERIAELQAEQRDVAQKVADQEKMLYLLERFIKYKMDCVSESINSKFEGVNFLLFQNQINGGLKETCELTIDGVPFGSLNNGHKIIGGLQIIKALQSLYDVRMPIFIDNAESVNDFNIPQMDCQLILLKVSEDKELKISV